MRTATTIRRRPKEINWFSNPQPFLEDVIVWVYTISLCQQRSYLFLTYVDPFSLLRNLTQIQPNLSLITSVEYQRKMLHKSEAMKQWDLNGAWPKLNQAWESPNEFTRHLSFNQIGRLSANTRKPQSCDGRLNAQSHFYVSPPTDGKSLLSKCFKSPFLHFEISFFRTDGPWWDIFR